MAVPFRYDLLAVDLRHLGSRAQLGHVGAEPHGPTHVRHVALGAHQVDHRMGGGRVEFAGIGPLQAQGVAGELHGHALQAEAQPQAGDVVLPGEARRGDLSLHASLAEPTGDHDAVEVSEAPLGQKSLYILGLDPVDFDLGAMMGPGVVEGLDHRQVGIDQAHVLADQADPDQGRGADDPVHQGPPLGQVWWGRLQAEGFTDIAVEALVVEDERDLVEAVGVGSVDHPLKRHVGQPGDLAL